ncbi:MAG: hypothetical protein V8S69_05450 [Dakarella massiliensis]
MAALGTGFCFLMTTLGAASVLFTGKESSPAFQRISLDSLPALWWRRASGVF